MPKKTNHHHAFSDGSKEDHDEYTNKAMIRRDAMTGIQATKKITDYLKQLAEIVRMDIKRAKCDGEDLRHKMLKERLAWVDGMLYWIEHNV